VAAPAQIWAIVVAGGSGRRFGQHKQFAMLADQPVAQWSVAACRPTAAGVVLVVPSGFEHAGDCGAERVVIGGATRSASVRCGLAAVPDEADVIIVHDAARPLASPTLFDAVATAAAETGAAICALPVSDTIKRVDDGLVAETLDRRALVAVQTPQAFEAALLRRAHAVGAEATDEATDDATLVERLGVPVRVVPGDPGNFKITTPADLKAAEQCLAVS
jgi:2-C-methyl-D-erythritol 4-phosphate cytidylyltransferase